MLFNLQTFRLEDKKDVGGVDANCWGTAYEIVRLAWSGELITKHYSGDFEVLGAVFKNTKYFDKVKVLDNLSVSNPVPALKDFDGGAFSESDLPFGSRICVRGPIKSDTTEIEVSLSEIFVVFKTGDELN